MGLTLPLGGSRGTSGEGQGLIVQLHPSRTIVPQRTTSVSPSPLRCFFSATLPERGALGAAATFISSVAAAARSKAIQIPDGPKESQRAKKKPATDRLRVG
jgi:hypothetical protein